MKLILKIIIILEFCVGGLVEPIGNVETEILQIRNTPREYTISRGNIIKYEIYGPKIIAINARKPYPKKYTKEPNISFKIQLQGSNAVYHKNEVIEFSKKVNSKKHPAHKYTKSEIIYLNIPKGNHRLEISTDERPVLFRLTSRKKVKREKYKTTIQALDSKVISINTGSKLKEYSLLKSGENVSFNINKAGLLWFFIRGLQSKDGLEPIVFRCQISDKIFQNIIFYSEPSLYADVDQIDQKVGKLRTYSLDITDFSKNIKIENRSKIDVLLHGKY